MASTNQSPFYQRAEADFLNASSDEERLECLDIMIKECPKHKSSENMLRNLKTRKKKVLEKVAKQKKSGRGGPKETIKKSEVQAILVGFPNVGKSSIFNQMANKESLVSEVPFTTKNLEQGIAKLEDVTIQIIDGPPFPHEDRGIISSADTLLIVIDSLDQLKPSLERVWKSPASKMILYSKTDLLDELEKRKLIATLKSRYKKQKFFLVSQEEKEVFEEIKKEIFKSSRKIRIYTKEPKKDATTNPLLLKENSTPKDVAEKILKGLSEKVKQTKIWGPSSKFAGQSVGLNHHLKDKDVIELHVK